MVMKYLLCNAMHKAKNYVMDAVYKLAWKIRTVLKKKLSNKNKPPDVIWLVCTQKKIDFFVFQ